MSQPSPPPDVPPAPADVPNTTPVAGPAEPAASSASALPGRWGVGVAAAGCLIGAATIYVVRPDQELWWAGAMRVGIVMSALWLALPSRDRPAAWADWDWKAVGFVLLCGLLSFRAPQIGVPLLAVWWFWRWLKSVPPTSLPTNR